MSFLGGPYDANWAALEAPYKFIIKIQNEKPQNNKKKSLS